MTDHGGGTRIIRIRPVLHAGQGIVASAVPPSSQGSLSGSSLPVGTSAGAAQPSKRRQISSFSRR